MIYLGIPLILFLMAIPDNYREYFKNYFKQNFFLYYQISTLRLLEYNMLEIKVISMIIDSTSEYNHKST